MLTDLSNEFLLQTLKKLDSIYLFRLRRTCKELKEFIELNSKEFNVVSKFSLVIIFNEKNVSFQIQGESKETVRPNDPIGQLSAVKFKEIHFGFSDFVQGQHDPMVILSHLKLFGEKLFVYYSDSCDYFKNIWGFLEHIKYDSLYLGGYRATIDDLRKISKTCISVKLWLDYLTSDVFSGLGRFQKAKLAFYKKQDLQKGIDEYLEKLVKYGQMGKLNELIICFDQAIYPKFLFPQSLKHHLRITKQNTDDGKGSQEIYQLCLPGLETAEVEIYKKEGFSKDEQVYLRVRIVKNFF